MTDIKDLMTDFASAMYNKSVDSLNSCELNYVVSKAVMTVISDGWRRSRNQHLGGRRACYFSAEFLVGRALYNNLMCTGLTDAVTDDLKILGNEIKNTESVTDELLGNGGLGRLAACFLDSGATLGLNLDGYGIRYRCGLFTQKIIDGEQKEVAVDWTEQGDPWSVRCGTDRRNVSFSWGDVAAVPYDMPIIGYGGKHVSTLRLWQSEPTEPVDFELFNEQHYDTALCDKNRAENICRFLYPNDSTDDGKRLRLRQQYFFSSASLQDIIAKYEIYHGNDFHSFAKYITVQLNDTHPVISIPELIRLLLKKGMSFDSALNIAKDVFNYTNHTVMQEALEKWDMSLIKDELPEIADIITGIFERQKRDPLFAAYPNIAIVQNGTVHMAYLACFVCKYINGVAKLHTEILKNETLADWYSVYPEKFQNKTNGITQRRFLRLCNPSLSALITELLGTDEWIMDLSLLDNLKKIADDKSVLDRFMTVKAENKSALADYVLKRDSILLNTDTIFDVQIKRLHEYKRQLLNILVILELYFEIKEGSLKDFYPTTFIFGAKAAPGYARAKGIIKLINEVKRLIESDSFVSEYIKIVFVSDYDVSYAERIVAAADVSEQISTAGTEASGTGNMKLMLNGAVTLGTYDGANIEIVQQAGDDNNYIFGARTEEIERIKDIYNPKELYNSDKKIKRCLDTLIDGTLSDNDTDIFKELYDSLLYGASWHKPDNYYLLLDFEDFLAAKIRLNRDYRDRYSFAKKCFLNTCSAGVFSSDRTVAEYARDIWHIV